jgi:hypothetical protein
MEGLKADSKATGGQKRETLFSWLGTLTKAGIKTLPSMAKTLAIQIGTVFLIQIIFWTDVISRFIPDFIKFPIIFLTATYNDIVPKTLYWIIIFTFGKKLLNRIRKTGLQKALRPIKWLIPEFKKSFAALEDKARPLLLMGAGVGLAVANNFASYSRFSGARNKIDKYFVALVISFTISYLLGEGRKHWMFKFAKLSSDGITRMLKRENYYTDNHTYVILSGFVLGLLADAPLVLVGFMYGGYIFGVVALIAGIALYVNAGKTKVPQ